LQDLSGGDNQHLAIDVVSEWFDGKNSLQRQRAVYKAIWEEMQVRQPP
jgi:stress-induced morphogen